MLVYRALLSTVPTTRPPFAYILVAMIYLFSLLGFFFFFYENPFTSQKSSKNFIFFPSTSLNVALDVGIGFCTSHDALAGVVCQLDRSWG